MGLGKSYSVAGLGKKKGDVMGAFSDISGMSAVGHALYRCYKLLFTITLRWEFLLWSTDEETGSDSVGDRSCVCTLGWFLAKIQTHSGWSFFRTILGAFIL